MRYSICSVMRRCFLVEKLFTGLSLNARVSAVSFRHTVTIFASVRMMPYGSVVYTKPRPGRTSTVGVSTKISMCPSSESMRLRSSSSSAARTRSASMCTPQQFLLPWGRTNPPTCRGRFARIHAAAPPASHKSKPSAVPFRAKTRRERAAMAAAHREQRYVIFVCIIALGRRLPWLAHGPFCGLAVPRWPLCRIV